MDNVVGISLTENRLGLYELTLQIVAKANCTVSFWGTRRGFPQTNKRGFP